MSRHDLEICACDYHCTRCGHTPNTDDGGLCRDCEHEEADLKAEAARDYAVNRAIDDAKDFKREAQERFVDACDRAKDEAKV
jgi:hypothetical protein